MRVARGVYRDRWGFRVIWPEHGRPKEKRFPLDAPLEILKKYRARQIADAHDLAAVDRSGSFVRDVARFLRQRKGRPSFKSDRAHLRVWAQRFRKKSRWTIDREAVAEAVGDWQAVGYSAREIRHRVRLLTQLYHALDGATATTPCDDLDLPRVEKARPIAVSEAVVRSVALELRKHELCGLLRDAKTRARYLVLATTGQRPAQVKRAQPFDVDLEKGVWYVRPAKGDRGAVLYFNDDMRAAWTVFTMAKAWGRYDSRSFAKTLRRCGWPRGMRPYNLRHTIGLTLSELGVDLGDIQAMLGHADINTTRQFYVPAIPARQQAASATIDHRLNAWSLSSAMPLAMGAHQEKGRRGENPKDSANRPKQKNGRLEMARRAK